MFIYSYRNVCSVLCILFHCVVLRTVCVYMCTVLLSPGVNPSCSVVLLFLLIVLFYVLFVCNCVLYYCHRVSTQAVLLFCCSC